jgi:hypothetical protein
LNAANSTVDAQNTIAFISQTPGQLESSLIDTQNIVDDLSGITTITSSGETTSTIGKIVRLQKVIDLLTADKLFAPESPSPNNLQTVLNIQPSEMGDFQARKDDFYTKLSSAMDDPNSPFGSMFGTLDTVSSQLAETKILGSSLSVIGACGILEKAQRLVTTNPTCSMVAVEKACNSTGGQ